MESRDLILIKNNRFLHSYIFDYKNIFGRNDTEKFTGCSIVVVRKAGGLVVRVRFSASRRNRIENEELLIKELYYLPPLSKEGLPAGRQGLRGGWKNQTPPLNASLNRVQHLVKGRGME